MLLDAYHYRIDHDNAKNTEGLPKAAEGKTSHSLKSQETSCQKYFAIFAALRN